MAGSTYSLAEASRSTAFGLLRQARQTQNFSAYNTALEGYEESAGFRDTGTFNQAWGAEDFAALCIELAVANNSVAKLEEYWDTSNSNRVTAIFHGSFDEANKWTRVQNAIVDTEIY